MVQYQIGVNPPTFFEIQKIAKLSGGSMGDVVANLLTFFRDWHPGDSSVEVTENSPQPGEGGFHQLWRSARGEFLPVGLKLRALYLGATYTAIVTASGIEFNGVKYDSPSSAAVAVKEAAGKSGASASTNGWEFWTGFDPKSNLWKSLKELKAK